ncbi:MAG: hypothetical protein AB7D27_12810 [Desulfomicrobium sp.]
MCVFESRYPDHSKLVSRRETGLLFFGGNVCARLAKGNDVSSDVEDLGGSGLQGPFGQMKSSFVFFAFAGTSIFVDESVRELRIDESFNE